MRFQARVSAQVESAPASDVAGLLPGGRQAALALRSRLRRFRGLRAGHSALDRRVREEGFEAYFVKPVDPVWSSASWRATPPGWTAAGRARPPRAAGARLPGPPAPPAARAARWTGS
jgi:hypothetical protein